MAKNTENLSQLNKDLFKFTGKQNDSSTKAVYSHKSAMSEAFSNFGKNKQAMFGFLLLAIIIILTIAFTQTSQDPLALNSNNLHAAPSSEHWFGTDAYGRDLWARTWWAIAVSMLLSLIATTINVTIATMIGITTGYFEKFDGIFKYVIKILYALPSILILILFSVAFGASYKIIILSLVVTGWVGSSQQVRAQTLRIRNLEFITASQTLGTNRFKILGTFFVYAIPTIVTQFVILFPRMILAEATLGFLGLSIPDVPTLGNLINDGRAYITTYPREVFIPLSFLVVVTVSIQLVGFGVEDAFGTKRTR